MTAVTCDINGVAVELKNLDKVFWPEKGLVKANLLDYYAKAGSFLIPYLKNRPFTLKRYPDGIYGKHFYQKQCPDYAPEWLQTVKITRGHKSIDYCMVNKLADLLWLVNQGCIEMHTWLTSWERPNNPDLAVFDLDPAPGASWDDVLLVARLVKQALDTLNLQGYPKTSGATGLHIYIPIRPVYDYKTVQQFTGRVSHLIATACPEKATVERSVKNRQGKVYVDYLQNGPGKTMASVYSVRPVPAATVSMPVSWEEIESSSIQPGQFTMENVISQLADRDKLFQPCLEKKQSLTEALEDI
ncbi:MAG: DNA polymerase domain-containing protein [Thermoanaerobacteraceae bacterium]|nr:DNA polymerase domain-containing protein [Thermoanaerobacteraceae bacterium]